MRWMRWMRCDARSRRRDNVASGTNARQPKRKWRVENGRMKVRIEKNRAMGEEQKRNSGEHTQQRKDRIGNVETVKTMRLDHPATRATD